MRREGFYIGVVALIVGGLALVGIFMGFVGPALALLAVAAGAAVAWKALDARRRRSAVRADEGVRLLNTVWIPVRDELAEVVRGGGRVETSESVWTHAPILSKQNSGGSFPREMERYIDQRRKVASLAASRLTTHEEIRQMQSEQQILLSISRELLPQAREIVEGMQGAAAGVSPAAVAMPAAGKRHYCPNARSTARNGGSGRTASAKTRLYQRCAPTASPHDGPSSRAGRS